VCAVSLLAQVNQELRLLQALGLVHRVPVATEPQTEVRKPQKANPSEVGADWLTELRCGISATVQRLNFSTLEGCSAVPQHYDVAHTTMVPPGAAPEASAGDAGSTNTEWECQSSATARAFNWT